MNNGKRMSCENCEYGKIEFDAKGNRLAWCRKLKSEIKGKRFKELNYCLFYEEKEK